MKPSYSHCLSHFVKHSKSKLVSFVQWKSGLKDLVHKLHQLWLLSDEIQSKPWFIDCAELASLGVYQTRPAGYQHDQASQIKMLETHPQSPLQLSNTFEALASTLFLSYLLQQCCSIASRPHHMMTMTFLFLIPCYQIQRY